MCALSSLRTSCGAMVATASCSTMVATMCCVLCFLKPNMLTAQGVVVVAVPFGDDAAEPTPGTEPYSAAAFKQAQIQLICLTDPPLALFSCHVTDFIYLFLMCAGVPEV